MMKAVLTSNEIAITENWDIIKIVGTKEQFDGINVGDEIEYVPSWSEYKLTDLDRQMYDKGFRYKKILVMKNSEDIELTNELVPVYIDTATPISEGKMREDAGDLRFYWWDEDTQAWEEISYWIDNDTVNSSNTKVILRIPKVSSSGYANVVVYYGARHYGRKDDLTIAFGNRSNGGKYLSFDGVDDSVSDVYIPVTSLGGTVIVFAEHMSDSYETLLHIGKDSIENYLLLRWGVSSPHNPEGYSIILEVNNEVKASVAESQSILRNGQVHMFGVVKGGDAVSSIINGQKAKTITGVTDWWNSWGVDTALLRIADKILWSDTTTGKWCWFTGDVYYVFVYNRALSDEEIQAIYDNPNDPPRAGLVLWLAPDSVDDINGIWEDKSGLGNDGTIYGVTPVEVRTFEESVQTSKVMSFDGVDDYAEVPHDNRLDNSEMSVAVWFKVRDQLATDWNANKILNMGNYGTRSGWWIDYAPSGSGRDGQLRYWTGDGETQLYQFTNYAISPDEIVNFVAVTDGSTFIKQFVNGSLDSTLTLTTTRATASLPLVFANYGAGYANIDIYRVMIWNRALSDDEVQQLHNDPNNPPLDGLVLWLDETSIDEANGKWLNKAPVLKSGYVETLDCVIYGATPNVLVDSAWTDDVDMVERGIKIRWRGKVVKKVESGNTVVLYVKTYNLMKLTGEV